MATNKGDPPPPQLPMELHEQRYPNKKPKTQGGRREAPTPPAAASPPPPAIAPPPAASPSQDGPPVSPRRQWSVGRIVAMVTVVLGIVGAISREAVIKLGGRYMEYAIERTAIIVGSWRQGSSNIETGSINKKPPEAAPSKVDPPEKTQPQTKPPPSAPRMGAQKSKEKVEERWPLIEAIERSLVWLLRGGRT